ncbi:MAG TPA: GNAT family N-acetyltransferase [Caulobacterales bacterium]|nr:GNAT family N-acetyltransferase [Caulobacterales bacterium]
MTEYAITLEQNGDRGRYFVTLPDGLEAEMTFRRDEGVMIIDHTGVPAAHEGHGVAFSLLTRAIADARAQNFKIRPRCSYVVAQFAHHAKDWADVLAS